MALPIHEAHRRPNVLAAERDTKTAMAPIGYGTAEVISARISPTRIPPTIWKSLAGNVDGGICAAP